jgi:heme exporter protein B
LRSIAAGIVWAGALLATSISLKRLFDSDHHDGTLDQILLSPQPLYLIVLGKVCAQCVVSAIPLIAVAPLLVLLLGATPQTAVTVVMSLALGVPALCLIGSIGAALTLGVRGSGFLVTALVLPLFVPVLIFGAAASLAPDENISLLAALLIMSAVFAPLATAAALRLAAE